MYPNFHLSNFFVLFASHSFTDSNSVNFAPFYIFYILVITFFQNTKVEVAVSDFEGNGFGYVYFFQSLLNYKGVPLLKSDAGQKLVNYDFKLTTGYLK